MIATIPGGESQIISINIDKASKLLPEEKIKEIKKELSKERIRRKVNLSAR